MNFYQEITLRPQPEIPLYFLWEKVYQQVHLAFAENADVEGNIKVGVAFPEYKRKDEHPLGDKMRIFSSSATELVALDITKWLLRLSDYVIFTKIRDVPDRIDGYAHFKRLRSKGNNEKLARRKAKREGISYEDALAYFKDRQVKLNDAPYVRMKSLSNANRFRLMIDHVCAEKEHTEGFDSYGLSAKSTVPIF